MIALVLGCVSVRLSDTVLPFILPEPEYTTVSTVIGVIENVEPVDVLLASIASNEIADL